jgi:Bacterial regulatory proteins, luxR family
MRHETQAPPLAMRNRRASERTVENHVGSALKKFGAATRTELAAKVNLKEDVPRTGMTDA